MKHFLLLLTLALVPCSLSLQAAEITAEDVARHLGIRFWKFDATSLPESYTVELQEIKDGRITNQNIAAFSSRSNSEPLVVGISIQNGLTVPTLSVGRDSMTIHEGMRRKIGSSVTHHQVTLTIGKPVVLCANYRSNGTVTVATGKIEDVESGLALLVTGQ